MKDWIRQLFTAIDRRDWEGFPLFFTDNGTFRFGNAPAVSGQDNIRKAVHDFFVKIKDLRHRITGVWEIENTVILEGEVTYTRLDDKVITLPFANILRMENDSIVDYRVYIDISALFV